MSESQSLPTPVPSGMFQSLICPKCHALRTTAAPPGLLDFDPPIFECIKCYRAGKAANDPMKSDVLGWLFGELRPPK